MQLLLTLLNADTFSIADAQRRVSGSLSIGRGKQAGWPLPDPTRMLSAVHCEIKAEKRGFTLTDFSRNGTRLNGEQLVRMKPITIASGDQIEIGPYHIAVSPDDASVEPTSDKTIISKRTASDIHGEKTMIVKPGFSPNGMPEHEIVADGYKKPKTAVVSPLKHQSSRSPKSSSREFVEAFCEGAAIDPDNIAARSDREFAHELGAIVHSILGGMHEISHMISEFRTVIGSSEKGPFVSIDDGKPATSAAQKRKQTERMLALYFGNLRHEEISAETVLNTAIDDATRHNKALFFAMQAALFRLLNEVSPTTIERGTKSGIIRSKPSRNWDAYLQKWEMLNTGGEDGMLDVFLRYFSEAYDAKIQSL
jgi:type VI secretion system protein ImpI